MLTPKGNMEPTSAWPEVVYTKVALTMALSVCRMPMMHPAMTLASNWTRSMVLVSAFSGTHSDQSGQ